MDQALQQEIINRYESAYFLVNRRLNALIRERMPEGLTIDQFSTLRYLRTKEKCTSSELADIFCVGRSSITAIITRLFDKQLIQRIPDEKDRRVTYLTLTDEGQRLCDKMATEIQEMLAKYLTQFDEHEARSFIETFERLAIKLLD